MDYLCDLHTHSVLSTHAYSSLTENIQAAFNIGLKYYGISEHQPDDCGIGCHKFALSNLRIVPSEYHGMKILKGVELNILENGYIDTESWLKISNSLNYGIASMHSYAYSSKHTSEENTNAYINAMKNKLVKIIGHMDSDAYPCDFRKVIEEAKKNHILIEVNNSSLSPNTVRVGADKNYLEILKICKEISEPIIINSDAHICYDVGRHDYAMEIINKAQFPQELIVNYNEDLFKEYFLTEAK